MKMLTKALSTFVVAAAFVAQANAVPMLNFEVGDNSEVELSNVSHGWFSKGAKVRLVEGLADEAFSLAEGQSYTFDFFEIWMPLFDAGSADLNATLSFDTPFLNESGSADTTWWSAIFISGGDLNWGQQPGDIDLGGGSIINLSFQNLEGIQFGSANWLAVEATVTAVAVPEPGSLALLSLGMIGLGLARRRRS